jgi:signal transduction histidine kinase
VVLFRKRPRLLSICFAVQEDGNAPKAQETIRRAMERARTTLHEARRAIQALRPAALEQNSLVDALGREVDEFAATTGMQAGLLPTEASA